MPELRKLDNIPVPAPKPDQTYAGRFFGQDASFVGLKRLLGAADYSKAGDRNAGLAAAGEAGARRPARILVGI